MTKQIRRAFNEIIREALSALPTDTEGKDNLEEKVKKVYIKLGTFSFISNILQVGQRLSPKDLPKEIMKIKGGKKRNCEIGQEELRTIQGTEELRIQWQFDLRN